ncbi:hypothetical protein EXE45_07810 [Halorubrum sp. SP9]|nr:hypothetical protein EXE45_07810 [Halorubrum sp. SP9]
MAVTSTVLDVSVLLLCVSASVVALGASDAGGPDGPTATDAADRLVTETATVTYRDGTAPNGTRRVHATRAELLALLAERDADGAFERRATESIRAGLGPRTRVDATVEVDGETDGTGAVDAAVNGGNRETAAAPTARSPDERSPPRERDGARLGWIEKPAHPFSIAVGREPTRTVGGGDESGTATATRDPIAVGPEPPRNADVAAVVIRQPIPGGISDGDGGDRSPEGVVRIVVRRW